MFIFIGCFYCFSLKFNIIIIFDWLIGLLLFSLGLYFYFLSVLCVVLLNMCLGFEFSIVILDIELLVFIVNFSFI